MQCKVDGCTRAAKFKADQLCQLHYFRRRRSGTFELARKPGRESFIGSDGYVMVRLPGHRMSGKNYYAAEHRVVAYEKYGNILPDCELCGIPLDWAIAVVDHIDEVRKNNDPSNLRPLCNQCNIQRTERLGISYRGAVAVDHDGRTMTPTEWAREPGVDVCGATIRRRIREGMSSFDAIYGRKITHNGNPKVDNRIRLTTCPAERRNAINITIGSETKTAKEWSRDPRCLVSDATLRNRVKDGWPHDLRILERIKP